MNSRPALIFINRIKQISCSLITVELFILSGAIVFSIFYEPFLVYSVVIGLFLGAVRWIVKGNPIQPISLNLPLILLLIMIVVSLCITPVLNNTLLQVLRLLNGVLLFFCSLRSISSLQSVYRVMKALGILGLIIAASSLLLVDWNEKFRFLAILIPKTLTIPKINGVHPNVMAGIVLMFLVGACAFLSFRWKILNGTQKIGLWFIVFFMSVILLLTQSRGALIALAVALTVLILLRFRYGWIVVLMGITIATYLIFQIGAEQIWRSVGIETGGTHTFIVREEIWLRARLIIQDFPLTGIGMGTFTEVTNRLYPLSSSLVNIPHAHNMFLQIAIDLGLPGLVAWLACWFTVLKMAWQLYRRGGDTLQALGASVLCGQIAIGVHGILDCVTWDTRPAVIIWAVWGLTVAAWLQLRCAQGASSPSALSPDPSVTRQLFFPIRSRSKTDL